MTILKPPHHHTTTMICGVSSDTQVLFYNAEHRICRKRADELRDDDSLFAVKFKNETCLCHTSASILRASSAASSNASLLLHIGMSHGKVLKCTPAQRVLKYTGNPTKILELCADEDDYESDDEDEDEDEVVQVEMVAADALNVGDYVVCYDSDYSKYSGEAEFRKYKFVAFHEYGYGYHHLVRVNSVGTGGSDEHFSFFVSGRPGTAVADCGVVFDVAAA